MEWKRGAFRVTEDKFGVNLESEINLAHAFLRLVFKGLFEIQLNWDKCDRLLKWFLEYSKVHILAWDFFSLLKASPLF